MGIRLIDNPDDGIVERWGGGGMEKKHASQLRSTPTVQLDFTEGDT